MNIGREIFVRCVRVNFSSECTLPLRDIRANLRGESNEEETPPRCKWLQERGAAYTSSYIATKTSTLPPLLGTTSKQAFLQSFGFLQVYYYFFLVYYSPPPPALPAPSLILPTWKWETTMKNCFFAFSENLFPCSAATCVLKEEHAQSIFAWLKETHYESKWKQSLE